MLTHSGDIPDNAVLSTDVCILGGGVAGLTLAKELQATGRDVLVVEQGGQDHQRSIQKALRGRVVGYPYWGLEYVRHAQVGGASNRWFLPLAEGGQGGRFRKMDAIDFEARDEIPHSGWPCTRADLEPYYDRASDLLGLDPDPYGAEFWAERGELLLPDSDLLRTVVFKFASRKPFAEIYPAELAASETVTLLTRSHVQSLTSHESGRAISAAQVAGPDGRRFRIRANIFVLALGGIENPRLLLLSNDQRPAGIGNEHDLVGRYLMEHPHFTSGVLRPSDPTLFDRDDFYSPHLRRTTTIQGKLGLREEVLRREGLRNFCFSLDPTWNPDAKPYLSPSEDANRVLQSTLRKGYLPDHPLRELLTVLFRGGPQLRRFVSEKAETLRTWLGHPARPVAYHLNVFSEQAPNPESRVCLSRAKVDPFGQPVAAFDLQFSRQDIADVVRGQELIRAELERTGLGRLEIEEYGTLPPPGIRGGFHHMGTTRMHPSPRHGVVDANSRVHGVENLFVAGSSVFPTGGFANPTLTICAMTVRLADHLKSIQGGRVSASRSAVRRNRESSGTPVPASSGPSSSAVDE